MGHYKNDLFFPYNSILDAWSARSFQQCRLPYVDVRLSLVSHFVHDDDAARNRQPNHGLLLGWGLTGNVQMSIFESLFQGMEFIFCIAMSILQQARIDLLRLDMEGMLKAGLPTFKKFR